MDVRRRGTKLGVSHSTLFVRAKRKPLVIIPSVKGEEYGSIFLSGSFGIHTFVKMVEDKLTWERELKSIQENLQKDLPSIPKDWVFTSAQIDLERCIDGDIILSPLVFLERIEDADRNFSIGLAVIPFDPVHSNNLASSDEEEILFARAQARTHAEMAMREEYDIKIELSDEEKTVLAQSKLTYLAKRGCQGLYNPVSIRLKLDSIFQKYRVEIG